MPRGRYPAGGQGTSRVVVPAGCVVVVAALAAGGARLALATVADPHPVSAALPWNARLRRGVLGSALPRNCLALPVFDRLCAACYNAPEMGKGAFQRAGSDSRERYFGGKHGG